MISIENLTKTFGPQTLFDEISFKINPRERVGMVGRNGHGKTTLFRIIVGEESYDDGIVNMPKSYRIGYVTQHLDFTENTILKEGMKGLPADRRENHWDVEKILAGLGFSQADFERPPSDFSGGFQVRLNLAKVLVSEPDLLLLDEPTNYLDITAIRWIERFLWAWPRELLLITHDRGFMDKVVTHTLAIHRRKMKKIEGDTGKLYGQIAQEEEIYEKTRQNDERKRKEVETFINRFRAKARLANMVQSRIKTLSKMEKKEKLEGMKTLDFSFRQKPFKGKQMFQAEGLSFGYEGGPRLIEDFSITAGAGERICVVGRNGKGKTTLLKLLAGDLPPQSGEISYNPNVEKGFYEQTNIKSLVDGRTVEEELILSAPDVDRQQARNICGAMMFEGEGALKKIGVLSGGEKSRVMLGKLLVTPLNLLLLDEPTNHLDMDANDALLAAIDNFAGTVVMVTHNEMFLHAVADRLVVFQRDGIQLFEGGYSEFLEKVGWEEEAEERHGKSAEPEADGAETKLSKKEARRRRSEIVTERAKLTRPIEKKIEKAEDEIERLEKELERLNTKMQAASEEGEGTKIVALSQSIHNCQTEIDRLFEDLEKFTDQLNLEQAAFEDRLARIDQMES